jgi:hypothetical protein
MIENTKPVWVAWTNTDLTEGRGWTYPLFVCESITTARRLGKGRSVQGSNCTITEELALFIEKMWYVPGVIQTESEEDKKKRLLEEEVKKVKRKAADLGLTEEEIALLKNNI